jgi:hypothetical protein
MVYLSYSGLNYLDDLDVVVGKNALKRDRASIFDWIYVLKLIAFPLFHFFVTSQTLVAFLALLTLDSFSVKKLKSKHCNFSW